jgi:integrase
VKAAREAETFKDAFADYITHEQKGRKGNATAGEVERAILKDCAEWLDWPTSDVTATDIGKLLRQVRDGGGKDKSPPRPYMANRLYAYLRTFLAWCAKPDVRKIAASPMVGMDRPWEGEEVRDRVFGDKELKAIWKAADEIGGTPGAFTKVLLLTGKRKSAVAAMRWTELDDTGLWTPPADSRRRKRTKRLHGIPLPKLAQRIIAPLRPKEGDEDASAYVFPARSKGTHLYPGSDLADEIKEKSGIDDFFFHALRHTLETRLAELKVPPHIRDLILDHAPARGAGEGYDHWHYRDEMLDALEKWAAHVEKLVSPRGVVVLR